MMKYLLVISCLAVFVTASPVTKYDEVLSRLQELMKVMGIEEAEKQDNMSPGATVKDCHDTDFMEPRYKKIMESHGMSEDDYGLSITCEGRVSRIILQNPIGTTRIDVEIDASTTSVKDCGVAVCLRDMSVDSTSCSKEIEDETRYFFPVGSTKDLYMDVMGYFMFYEADGETPGCVSLQFTKNLPSCCN